MSASSGLTIDWTQMPTYNTIMAVAAGAALLSLASLGRQIQQKQAISPEGWAINFGVLGTLLTITGAHMTLTWPFAKYFPFDNIVFGEPSLAFGVLLLATAFYLWTRSALLREGENIAQEAARVAQPLTALIIGLGLSLIAIACAGLFFQLFAAPPQEPISGRFASYPWVEAIFISGLFGLVGVAALLFPFAVRRAGEVSGLTRLLGGVLSLSGAAILAVRGAELLHPYRADSQHHAQVIRTPMRSCSASVC